jgi:hypothetical protein
MAMLFLSARTVPFSLPKSRAASIGKLAKGLRARMAELMPD